MGARQTAPSSSCGSQVPLGSLAQRFVTQSVEEVQRPPTGILHVSSKKHNPDSHSVLSVQEYPAGDRGTHTARSPVGVASTTAHRSVAGQSVADMHSLGQTPLMQTPVSHWLSAVQSDPAVTSGMSSQIRSCSISWVSPQRCPSRQSWSVVHVDSLMMRLRSCSCLSTLLSSRRLRRWPAAFTASMSYMMVIMMRERAESFIVEMREDDDNERCCCLLLVAFLSLSHLCASVHECCWGRLDWIARMCRSCQWDVQVKSRPVTYHDAQSVVVGSVLVLFFTGRKSGRCG